MRKITVNPRILYVCSFAYGLGSCALGLYMQSWWLIVTGAYNAVLATARFCVHQVRRRAQGNSDLERFSKKITGILLVILSFCLIGINVLAAVRERGLVLHKIIMITMAAYTFTRLTVAIIGTVKAAKRASAITQTLRNIDLADALVAICTLQRSMLVSFPGLEPGEIQLFNILTGTGVWLTVLLLGLNLLGGKRINMAKSKIAETNEKIARAATDGYKAIEHGVTKGYTKVEDSFVSAFLLKEGETLEEAKERLRKNSK